MKKKLLLLVNFYLLCAYSFAFCASQQSVVTKNKQPINFIGTIKKITGKTYEVDNISISGALNDIPVYKKPISQESDPQQDTEFIHLMKIKRIYRSPDHVKASLMGEQRENNIPKIRRKKSAESLAQEGVYNYNGRDYIEINITFTNNADDTYLIELSKELWCNRKDTDTHKEVSFEALESIDIQKIENSNVES